MQITEHIHALKVPFQVTDSAGSRVSRFVYVYLIYGEKILVIDSGVSSTEHIILDYLEKTGRAPQEISQLVLTHSHPDHLGAAKALQIASGCSIAAHAAERAWMEDVHLQYRDRPVPGFHSLVGGSIRVDRTLEDGEVLDLGGDLSLMVIHTPGHSRGSISLWLREEGALFSADAIPVAGDMPIYEDVRQSVRSIQCLKTIPGINLLLAAWDEPRRGERACQIMDEGLAYLQQIHEAVLKVAGSDAQMDSMELCLRTLEEMNMPHSLANPLVARSFQSHLQLLGRKSLF
jgi:hydroxyacylglutathione hydrolase